MKKKDVFMRWRILTQGFNTRDYFVQFNIFEFIIARYALINHHHVSCELLSFLV